jgi:hypothetical protein
MEELNLMPYQSSPYNGDEYACAEVLKLRDEFEIETAIELGSCVGGTALWLAQNFNYCYTIEINPIFRKEALKRLDENLDRYNRDKVFSYLGNTIDILPKVLKEIDIGDTPFIYQDSHWLECPLQQELKIIAESGIKPVLLIHDFKTDNPAFGYDSYNGQDFTFEWVEPMLNEIYGVGGYEWYYNTKSSGAMRGILYVKPKK